ncbi:hypothetical protein FWG76_02020 [Candidatus Saccharibacteria bacterium]|nr:hypothetical protein [Candidatus Saccharibacteria bacterium]
MAKQVPDKGYGGIYGEEAAGKSPENISGRRAEGAADHFAAAEKSASRAAPKISDKTTSSSSDVAENGYTPKYTASTDKKSGVGKGLAGAAAAGGAVGGGRLSKMFSGSGGSKKPLFAIGGLTGLIALLMLTASSLLPVHLIENMIGMRNSFGTTAEMRGTRLIRRTIGTDTTAAMNTFSQRNTMSQHRITQLNRGLEAEGLRFRLDGDNVVLQSALDGNGRINLEPNGQMRWNTAAVNEAEFATLVRDHPNIRNGFNKGSSAVTGRTSGWYNRAMAFFLNKNALTRNLFHDFIGRAEGNANFREAQARIATAEQRVAKTNIDLATQDRTTDPATGEPIDTVSQNQAGQDFEAAKVAVGSDIRARALQIAGRAGGISAAMSATCAVFLAVGAASAVFAAIEMSKGLQVVAAWFEAGQKMMAGEGDDSYHALGDALTEQTVTTAFDENGNEYELHNGAPRSATESAGLTHVLVGSNFRAEDDPSAMKWHAEKAVGYMSVTGGSVAGCFTAMIAGGIIGAVAEVFSVFVSFVPIGGQAFAVSRLIAGLASNIAISAGIATALGLALGAIVPMLARGFVTSMATDVGGEDFGNMIGSVGGRYMGGAHQANGGVVATEERALAYFRETQNVLARQAEVERQERSPFDITNRNTFLGSIAFNMSGFAASNGSLFGNLTGLASVAQMSRLPWQFNASAASALEFREGLGNCPQLSQLYPAGITDAEGGRLHTVACDPFGYPMRSNDLATINFDPAYIYWKTAATCDGNECSFGKRTANSRTYTGENLDGTPWSVTVNATVETDNNGLEKINPKSDLGKMVVYGVNRSTDPGVIDVNIMMAESNAGPAWLGWVPGVGNIQQMISAINQSNALASGWVDGKNYCNGCTPEWDTTYRYLNQYIVDSNLYESMGSFERSPVVAMLEDEIWPTLDQSAAGILARNTGMPKSLVVDTLAWVNDMLETPQDVPSLIASAPNIYSQILQRTSGPQNTLAFAKQQGAGTLLCTPDGSPRKAPPSSIASALGEQSSPSYCSLIHSQQFTPHASATDGMLRLPERRRFSAGVTA